MAAFKISSSVFFQTLSNKRERGCQWFPDPSKLRGERDLPSFDHYTDHDALYRYNKVDRVSSEASDELEEMGR